MKAMLDGELEGAANGEDGMVTIIFLNINRILRSTVVEETIVGIDHAWSAEAWAEMSPDSALHRSSMRYCDLLTK